MTLRLSNVQRHEFLRRGYSRRDFGKIATLLGAGATLPFYGEAALAQLSQVKDRREKWKSSNGPS